MKKGKVLGMAQKKNYYYVLVCTEEGAKFITDIGDHHTAFWNWKEKPYEMSKSYAQDMVKGLNWNGFCAYMIHSEWELERQPYNYEKYELTFTEREANKE